MCACSFAMQQPAQVIEYMQRCVLESVPPGAQATGAETLSARQALVPVSAIENWFESFSRRLRADPALYRRGGPLWPVKACDSER